MILSRAQEKKEPNLFAEQKEREGFEPSIVLCFEHYTGFQARSYQPLGHLSEREFLFSLYSIPSNRTLTYKWIPL